ncbi:hypothetical protein [Thermoanaerobacterium sp. RBIITD]|uniref:hypothetical protein n=1 Tax=Thermoanaerobacterium sp. RBIITD TaxID=1550240 RepID=UPI000BC0AABB|nr:hypothetical protein [Thermoanaerobacterium sp. RBIITD]SNX52968.1 hypothetical protein SAMN05660242_0438 [Thermoanaerobacterium sp. RBIITD]
MYLLDDYLKMEIISFMPVHLLEKIVESVRNVSYRKAERILKILLGKIPATQKCMECNT